MKTEKPRKAVKGVLGQKMCGAAGQAQPGVIGLKNIFRVKRKKK